MKPGDHPDFFRFPAPAGRSRESQIVLDRNGLFSNAGVPIEHPGMARAFASWIALHPDDGRFILTNRYDWTYFTVEDVPFFVRSVMRMDDGAPSVVLSDGTEEPLDAGTLQIGAGDALYVRVKGRRFEAKFTPSAQTQLLDWVEEDQTGQPVLAIGGALFPAGIRPGSLR